MSSSNAAGYIIVKDFKIITNFSLPFNTPFFTILPQNFLRNVCDPDHDKLQH